MKPDDPHVRTKSAPGGGAAEYAAAATPIGSGTEPAVKVAARVCHVVFPRLVAAGGAALPSHLPQIDYAQPLAIELNWGCARYEERPVGGRERPYTGAQ